jgi:ComF family protein
MRALWRGLLELLLPTRCVICQHLGAKAVCAECLAELEAVGDQHCLRCGRRRETLFASPDCGECFGDSLGVQRARSHLVYNAAGRALLAEFKFHKRIGAGLPLIEGLTAWLGGGLAAIFDDPALSCDVVVPVPLHAARIRARRFNQAELVARSVARTLSIACQPRALARIRETPSQVGLSANQRQENVRGAFAVPASQRRYIAGKGVLLIDDLMTTGATLAACARALRKGGSGAVYGLTLFSTHYSAEDSAGPAPVVSAP